MNIIYRLTARYMLQNKKRTLVTIIGIAISVAMFTAVATIGMSGMDLMQRQKISYTGKWHAVYENLRAGSLSELLTSNVSEYSVIRHMGHAETSWFTPVYAPYIQVDEYTADAFRQMNIELKEGRLPENEGEIVLSSYIASFGDNKIKLNDTIKLHVEKIFKYASVGESGANYTYTVVGIIEPPYTEGRADGYAALSLLDANSLQPDDRISVPVFYKNVSAGLYDETAECAANAGMESFVAYSGETVYDILYNSELLQFYGVSRNTTVTGVLYTFILILVVIIIAGSVSLIYNAFSISLNEKSRDLGMLSSVGATRSQRVVSVYFEGTILSIISIPIGMLAGTVGIGITFMAVNSMIKNVFGVTEDIRLIVSPASLAFAGVLSIVTVFISMYIPARKASKISPMDAIRQSNEVKLSPRAVRTWKLTRKIFGFEAEIGLKNMKRNRRRYRAVICSLVISIVLFISVSSYMFYLEKSIGMTDIAENYDIGVNISVPGSTLEEDAYEESMRQSSKAVDEVTEEVLSIGGVKEYVIMERLDTLTAIDKDRTSPHVYDRYNAEDEDGTRYVDNLILALDDAYLKKYAESIGVDYSRLTDTENMSCILIDKANIRDEGKFVEVKVTELRKGDQLKAWIFGHEGMDDTVLTLNVEAVTDEVPMGMTRYYNNVNTYTIISHKVYDKLTEGIPGELMSARRSIFMNVNDGSEAEEAITDITRDIPNLYVHVSNIQRQRQSDADTQMLIKVFVYGFIVLITLICTANIFNTISTSMALRMRELAMLKSVGMTPREFGRMINYESIFYGVKALIYGLPAGFILSYAMYDVLRGGFVFEFTVPLGSYAVAVVATILLVGAVMMYSGSKIKKANIIDVLKKDSMV